MIFGDPFLFAFRLDVVEQWNDDSGWVNGIFEIYIDGNKYPNHLDTTEFRVNLFELISKVDEKIVSLSQAEREFVVMSFYEGNRGVLNKFIFERKIMSLHSAEMEDSNVYIYFLCDKYNDYILLSDNEVFEVFEYESNYILGLIKKMELNKKSIFSIKDC